MANAADLDLSPTQFANALGIIAAVRAYPVPAMRVQRVAVIAVETALTESGMRMIASANVPASQKFPHELLNWTSDGLGHDHASCGMFQQQTGTRWTPAGFGSDMNQTTMSSADGWGTPAELMDAQISATKFLNALANVDWQKQDNWVAAQNVQHSAYDGNPRKANNFSSEYGGNYHGVDARAQRIVAALWDQVDGEDDMTPAQMAELKQAIQDEVAKAIAAIHHDTGVMVVGDSAKAAAGLDPQTHPHNLAQIDRKLDAMMNRIQALEAKPRP